MRIERPPGRPGPMGPMGTMGAAGAERPKRGRVPWGSIILLLIAADGVSLYLFFAWLREGGRGGLESFGLVVLYVFLAFMLGGWAIRAGGALSMRNAVRELRQNRTPQDPLLNGLLSLAGGLLIMFPGLFSDVLGLALLLPPTRTLARAGLRRRVTVRGPDGRPVGAPHGAQPGGPAEGPVEVREYRLE